MADSKISELPAAVVPSGSDEYIINQSGVSKKITQDQLLGQASRVDNIVTVSSSGADYTSIKDAIDYVATQSPSDTDRWQVSVGPGSYTEDPMTLIPYVDIRATGDRFTTKIVASTTGANLFTVTGIGITGVEGFTISGVTGAAGFYSATATVALIVQNVVFINCKYGAHTTSGLISMTNVSSTPSSVMTHMLYADGGVIQSDRSDILSEATFAVYAFADNGGNVGINALFSQSSNIGTVFKLDNGATGNWHNSYINNCTTGIELDNASNMDMTAVVMDSNMTNHLLINDSGSKIRCVAGRMASDKFIFPNNYSNEVITFIDIKENDEGFRVMGELGVGRPERGSESVFGGGDSYTRGMMVYEYNGSTYSDKSEEAQSPSGSTFTIPGLTANNAVYLSSDLHNGDYLHFYGIKSSTSIATVLGGGEIVLEYWDGSAWVESNHMSVDSSGSYLPHAKELFEQTGSQQIRFSSEMLTDWAKSDPVSNGIDRFWVRFRVNTAITTAPIFNQFKLHTNRREINADGWPEYFGSGRPIGTLPWDFGLVEAANSSPGNTDVYVCDNLAVGRVENLFQNGATDRVGFNAYLPQDLDTSCPITLTWSVRTDDNTAGDIVWVVRNGYTADGDSVYADSASAPTTGPNELSTTITESAPVASDTQKTYSVTIDVSNMISRKSGGYGDVLWVTLERTGGAGGDTHNGDVAGINLTANYIKWCDGGHI